MDNNSRPASPWLDDRDHSAALAEALRRWRHQIGEKHVITDQNLLTEASQATFSTSQQVSAILYPSSVQELQSIVRIAEELGTPLYPVSRGRNWGLGSRVPVIAGCCVVDLSRLNRIVEFDETLSYVTIEPGVSFQQLSDFLKTQNSKLFLSVIGGPPDASVIANTIERGEGLGPLGQRFMQVCGLEVVLANGELLSTGFVGVSDTKVSGLSNAGLGPALDGLFSQSNLGIVVRMRVWLAAKPESFRVFLFQLKEGRDLSPCISALRTLQQQRVLEPCSVALWNKYKLLASQQQYPWHLADGEVLRGALLSKAFSRAWKDTAWFGFGAIYSGSKALGKLEQKLLRSTLKAHVDRLTVVNDSSAKLLWALDPILQRFSGMDMREVLDSIFFKSVYMGNPIRTSLKSVYWRKKEALPENLDPDRDRCGLIWLCNVVPFTFDDIAQSSAAIEEICFSYGIEPNIAYLNVSQRALHLFVVLVYDRELPGADANAMQCHDQLFETLQRAGYSAYRLGIHSMHQTSLLPATRSHLLRELKNALDPKQILAPGRYEVR